MISFHPFLRSSYPCTTSPPILTRPTHTPHYFVILVSELAYLISIGKNLNKSQEYDESRVEKNSEALEKSLEEFGKAGLGEEQSIQETEKNRALNDILQNITTTLEKNERQNCSIPLCER